RRDGTQFSSPRPNETDGHAWRCDGANGADANRVAIKVSVQAPFAPPPSHVGARGPPSRQGGGRRTGSSQGPRACSTRQRNRSGTDETAGQGGEYVSTIPKHVLAPFLVVSPPSAR